MNWFLLSILTAITVATRDVTVKKISKNHKAMEIAAIELLWSLPYFLIGLLFIEIPELNRTFWWNFGISLPLNCLSYFFYVTALTIAPLSLTVPLLSFAGVTGKKAIIYSSPLFFGFFFFFICNLTMLCGILWFTDVKISKLLHSIKLGQWLGLLFLLHIVSHCLAIMGTNAAYMISLKRTSILFTVILGWILFKEEHFKFRGPAALLMFVGALLIAFWGY